MKYEVIRDFNDAQDGNYAYHEGDIYPRDGAAPSEQRIVELMGSGNGHNASLIKPYTEKKVVDTPKVEKKMEVQESVETPKENSEEVVWTEEEINKMPFMKLKSVAKQNGIDIEDKKASEIREELIKRLVKED